MALWSRLSLAAIGDAWSTSAERGFLAAGLGGYGEPVGASNHTKEVGLWAWLPLLRADWRSAEAFVPVSWSFGFQVFPHLSQGSGLLRPVPAMLDPHCLSVTPTRGIKPSLSFCCDEVAVEPDEVKSLARPVPQARLHPLHRPERSCSPRPITADQLDEAMSTLGASSRRAGLKATGVAGTDLEFGDFKLPLLLANISAQMLGDGRAFALVLTVQQPAATSEPDDDGIASVVSGEPEREIWVLIVDGGEEAFDSFMALLGSAGALRPDLRPSTLTVRSHPVGVGGHADVFQAVLCPGQCRRNGGHSQSMALKVLHKDLGHKSKLHSDMLHEVEMLAFVQGHRNIITFHGLLRLPHPQTEKMTWAMATEFCAFGDLHDQVARSLMVEKRAREVFRDVFNALAFIHDRDIVHRDVKPENLFLTADNRTVLADFGVACCVTDDAKLESRFASIGYAAPEVLRGKEYGKKVDVFGAGCTLFFAITGRCPFGKEMEERHRNNRRCRVDWGQKALSQVGLLRFV